MYIRKASRQAPANSPILLRDRAGEAVGTYLLGVTLLGKTYCFPNRQRPYVSPPGEPMTTPKTYELLALGHHTTHMPLNTGRGHTFLHAPDPVWLCRVPDRLHMPTSDDALADVRPPSTDMVVTNVKTVPALATADPSSVHRRTHTSPYRDVVKPQVGSGLCPNCVIQQPGPAPLQLRTKERLDTVTAAGHAPLRT
ncbi:uncharacterized protein LY79DRAFT_691589 [Colletotrichum navitas]|uniref:Uncharacterized protein n=1 Tax=Colletotrichum navitas TaxID=681940 RepID=A0AAD8PUF9_9PEZI|nr:uncharacterized protein LY79DRAFT_691589 [Colletotrichum navitas]KAK1584884.1 hypothetical protein LY79DRAFT_691589 [Colletotrichum navitas]